MTSETIGLEPLENNLDAENEVESLSVDEEIEVEVTIDEGHEEVALDAETEVEIPPTDEGEIEEDSEVAEDVEDAEAEEEAEVEEAEVEEVEDEESEGDEDESDEDDGLEETLASLQRQIETLNNTVKELTEANIALKKSNRKLSNKLQAEKNKKEAFIENVKGLSVQLLPEEEKKKPKEEKVTDNSSYYNGDGIGEI